VWRDAGALAQIRAALRSGGPAVQRAAAEALGRIGAREAVADLLAAAAGAADRVLEHSLTYALIETGDAAATTEGLRASAAGTQRAALIALDQIGGLSSEAVVQRLDATDDVVRQTAWWIAERHPEWSGALVPFFAARLDRAAPDEALGQRLALFASDPAIRDLLARSVTTGEARARMTALTAMSIAATSAVPAATRVKELPAAWVDALSRALASEDDDSVARALSVVRAIPPAKSGGPNLEDALLALARNRSRTAALRVEALAARQAGSTLDAGGFALLRARLAATQPAGLRASSAAAIEKSRLDGDQLLALAGALASAGPLELPRLLPPFEATTDEKVGLALIAGLDRSSSRSTVRADILRPRLAKYPESVRTAGDALLASIDKDAAKQAERLNALLGSVQGGDVVRGQAVFNSPKAACLSCHAIGYVGGRLGPDLTRVGQVRGERDLLEAVVFPSASFARGFEPMAVRTRSGVRHAGVLRSDSPEEVVLTEVGGAELRIARRDITEIEPGTVSLMPPGYGEILTTQELADLLAFLRAAR
jgi:putative heme-binding domain-containing protein